MKSIASGFKSRAGYNGARTVMLIQKEFHFGSSLARSCQKLLSKVVPSSN